MAVVAYIEAGYAGPPTVPPTYTSFKTFCAGYGGGAGDVLVRDSATIVETTQVNISHKGIRFKPNPLNVGPVRIQLGAGYGLNFSSSFGGAAQALDGRRDDGAGGYLREADGTPAWGFIIERIPGSGPARYVSFSGENCLEVRFVCFQNIHTNPTAVLMVDGASGGTDCHLRVDTVFLDLGTSTGGGIKASNGHLTLTNFLIKGGRSPGESIDIGGGWGLKSIREGTIYNNTGAGVLFGSATGTFFVYNVLIDRCGVGVHFGGPSIPTVENCAVLRSTTSTTAGTFGALGAGCLVPPVIPLYEDEAGGDYRPLAASPVVNAGRSAGCASPDYFGTLRPIAVCDIGYAEFPLIYRTYVMLPHVERFTVDADPTAIAAGTTVRGHDPVGWGAFVPGDGVTLPASWSAMVVDTVAGPPHYVFLAFQEGDTPDIGHSLTDDVTTVGLLSVGTEVQDIGNGTGTLPASGDAYAGATCLGTFAADPFAADGRYPETDLELTLDLEPFVLPARKSSVVLELPDGPLHAFTEGERITVPTTGVRGTVRATSGYYVVLDGPTGTFSTGDVLVGDDSGYSTAAVRTWSEEEYSVPSLDPGRYYWSDALLTDSYTLRVYFADLGGLVVVTLGDVLECRGYGTVRWRAVAAANSVVEAGIYDYVDVYPQIGYPRSQPVPGQAIENVTTATLTTVAPLPGPPTPLSWQPGSPIVNEQYGRIVDAMARVRPSVPGRIRDL